MPQIGADAMTRSLARVADAQARVREAARQAAAELTAEREAERTPAEQDEGTLTEDGA
jgi:hypothetical protein